MLSKEWHMQHFFAINLLLRAEVSEGMLNASLNHLFGRRVLLNTSHSEATGVSVLRGLRLILT